MTLTATQTRETTQPTENRRVEPEDFAARAARVAAIAAQHADDVDRAGRFRARPSMP